MDELLEDRLIDPHSEAVDVQQLAAGHLIVLYADRSVLRFVAYAAGADGTGDELVVYEYLASLDLNSDDDHVFEGIRFARRSGRVVERQAPDRTLLFGGMQDALRRVYRNWLHRPRTTRDSDECRRLVRNRLARYWGPRRRDD